MAEKSRIEWTEATWSPVAGCTKESAGCKHCYAKREVDTRWSRNPKSHWFGRRFEEVRCRPETLSGARSPLTWKRPRRIFVCPQADLFHPEVPDEFIDQVFAVMAICPQHTFQVLTKRAARMRDYLNSADVAQRIGKAEAGFARFGAIYKSKNGVENVHIACSRHLPLPNVWLGVSVEDQAAADERIPMLRQTPAAVRWISAEPLLGPVALGRVPRGGVGPQGNIDWIVTGGESGPQARPMHPDWARSLRDQCAAAGVPFLFKQWGEWLRADLIDFETQNAVWRDRTHIQMRDLGLIHGFQPPMPPGPPHFGCDHFLRVGKRAAGRLLDGVLHDDYPEGHP